MKFALPQNLFEKIIYAIMTGVGVFGTNELKSLNDNIQQLNTKMAVIVEKIQYLDKEQLLIKEHLLKLLEKK